MTTHRALPPTVACNGPIFDGTRVLPPGSAVGMADGRVVAVGPEDVVRAALPDAETLDLRGRLLHPGFTDAHIHALAAGVEMNACDLSSAGSETEALAIVAEYAATSDSEWISGAGWSMAHFEGGCPTAASLDAVVGDRPAFILNRDHHGAWVNSRALELAGVDANTPDPSDGRIERDQDGNPTGTLHEGAMDLVGKLVPAPGTDEMLAGLVSAQRYLHSYGITGWQEAIVGDYPGMADLDGTYRHAVAAGTLTGAVVGASWLPRPTTVDDVPAVVEHFVKLREQTAGTQWSLHSVKIMVDGVVENRTALLAEPYLSDEVAHDCACAPNVGLGYFDPEVLIATTIACDAAGLDVHFHAIGDRAVTQALDAVEAARLANGITEGRHHIAHIQLIDPVDVPRFAQLGVSANMQALWACNDAQMIALVLPAVGDRRYGWNYPFADLRSCGTHLVMGSDWSVSTPDPWAAISVAVNRVEPGSDAEPLLPGQALDLQTCLTAYTRGSAWVNRRTAAGVFRPGADADCVVADRDPFAIDPTDLWRVRTDLTIAAGRVVYERAPQ